ncbi:family 16 glycosylhydrolase [Bacillus subtilis]|uniref:family 16 glycosylhydrolase n=1 Tax=Bacillus subtilis TaxID=1423 RepID=UPI0035B5E1EB
MKIAKVINNNVISVVNEQGKELVVMGRGLAFQKKSGDDVDEARIEKVFTLDNKDVSEKFKTLLYDIPIECMEVSEEIISYAKLQLGKKLNDSIYVSLTDHINFAIQRNQKGLDIEFLGKDTTKVQFNYYTNGAGNHEKIVDLGFDAANAYHTYAFDWQPNSIKWYVDGQLKHTATNQIPTTPGKIMMNLWNGTGVDEWLGSYNGVNPLYAHYDWVRYTKK